MTNRPKIKEIFVSIQGEGPYIGFKQFFIRFCGCNLKCAYCDTDYSPENALEYAPEELAKIVNKYSSCHSVSLTGGEPLLHTDFLKDFLPLCTLPIYLETNAVLAKQAAEIIDFVDYVSADIKLPGCTGINNLWEAHDRFFEVCRTKDLFAKVVFDNTITEEEICRTCVLGEKYGIEIILQPVMYGDKPGVNAEFTEKILDLFLRNYKNVRIIPQMHKSLGIR